MPESTLPTTAILTSRKSASLSAFRRTSISQRSCAPASFVEPEGAAALESFAIVVATPALPPAVGPRGPTGGASPSPSTECFASPFGVAAAIASDGNMAAEETAPAPSPGEEVVDVSVVAVQLLGEG